MATGDWVGRLVKWGGRPYFCLGERYGERRYLALVPLGEGGVGWMKADPSECTPCDEREHRPCDGLSRLVLESLRWRDPPVGVSMRSGATEFRPFQFRPLLVYLRNPRRRVLIADEAGLGKTVSATYILVEEMARSPLPRVVVVCPAHLLVKWRGDLRQRFGLEDFRIASGHDLLDALSQRRECHYIVSMDAARGRLRELESALRDVRIDMLIVDEAHHVVGRGDETVRRKFVQALSRASERVVAITAAPMQLELSDFQRLLEVTGLEEWGPRFRDLMELQACLNEAGRRVGGKTWGERDLAFVRERLEKARSISLGLGRELQDRLDRLLALLGTLPGDPTSRLRFKREIWEAGPLSAVMTRATRREVGEEREREVVELVVELDRRPRRAHQHGREVSVSERSLFEEVDFLFERNFSPVHRRQLSSCLPAIRGLLASGMEGFTVWCRGARHGSGPDLEEIPEPDDEGVKEALRQEGWGPKKRRLTEEERRECERLAGLFNLLDKDTKLERTMEVLRTRGVRKAIIFTQFKHTLQYLANRVKEWGYKCFTVWGEVEEPERSKRVREFQSYPGPAILVATDALCEGVDVHSANCVVNYDLPFNPMVVEERIGRVDRIGQKSKRILIINVLVKGGEDERIHALLGSRVEGFTRYIGELPPLLEPGEEGGAGVEEPRVSCEEDICRLKESVLLGLEDVLDEEIREAQRNLRLDLSELRSLLLLDFLSLVLGPGKADLVSPSEVSLALGWEDVERLFELSVSLLGDLSAGGAIRQGLGDSARRVLLTTRPGGPGEYLPLMHPLMRAALETLRRNTAEGFALLFEGAEEERALLVTEHALPTTWGLERRWKWWTLEGGRLSAADRPSNESLLGLRGRGYSLLGQKEALALLPDPSPVEKEHEAWVRERLGPCEGIKGTEEKGTWRVLAILPSVGG